MASYLVGIAIQLICVIHRLHKIPNRQWAPTLCGACLCDIFLFAADCHNNRIQFLFFV